MPTQTSAHTLPVGISFIIKTFFLEQILPVLRSTFAFSGSSGTFWNPGLMIPFDVDMKLNLSLLHKLNLSSRNFLPILLFDPSSI